MLSLANARMRACQWALSRASQAKACRRCTTRFGCPLSLFTQPAAADETSFPHVAAAVEQEAAAGASWTIPWLLRCGGREALHGESFPWSVWCLAAAAAVAVAKSLDSSRENQVLQL